jgi:hypothetical protein
LCSVHDTVELEARGIPATTVITSAFRSAAECQFRARGMAGHPYVELPHPVSNLPREAMRVLTERHLDQVVRQLTAAG